MSSPHHAPYWGKVTSSVDWCEVNYEITPYVAEFFNTLTSFALALVGVWGIYLHPWAEYRFHVAFLATVAVGLGSVAFHGSLQKFCQALDEVPMLYSALSFAYIGLVQRYQMNGKSRLLLGSVLALHACFTTYLNVAFEGHYQFGLFILSFGTAQTYALYTIVLIYRKRKRMSSADPVVWIFERGLTSYVVAFVCWFTEMFFCEYVNPAYPQAILPFNPHLHAIWHILISMGLYYMALLLLFERVESKYGIGSAKLEFTFLIIGYVKLVPNKEKR